MTFNNRIIRTTFGFRGKKKVYDFAIHEVYYDEKGRIDGWTNDSMRFVGESPKEMWENILFRLEAFKAPILELYKDKKGKEHLRELK